MPDLKVLSYLPNPRLFKATIAARFSGASIEVVGAKPHELVNWLWDYEARELTAEDKAGLADIERIGKRGFVDQKLYKTDAFLKANPYGDVPAAFGEGGDLGLFESNSIMRAAARLGPNGSMIYGRGNPLIASRIDGFLDRTLLFARETQRFLLAISGTLTESLVRSTVDALESYLVGIEQALAVDPYIAGEDLSLADIAFVCEMSLLSNEKPLYRKYPNALDCVIDNIAGYPASHQHLLKLMDISEISEDLGLYRKQMPEVG